MAVITECVDAKAKLSIVARLVAARARPDLADSTGLCPLHSREATPDLFQLLLDVEPAPNVNVQDRHGETPLHYHAKAGNATQCALLVECKALVDAADWKGDTPLILAMTRGKPQALAILLHAGASLTAANKMGQTATTVQLTSPDQADGYRQCVDMIASFKANTLPRPPPVLLKKKSAKAKDSKDSKDAMTPRSPAPAAAPGLPLYPAASGLPLYPAGFESKAVALPKPEQFHGDFDLPLPLSQLTKVDHVVLLALFALSFISVQSYSVDLVASNPQHAPILARVLASLGDLKSRVTRVQASPVLFS